MDYYVPFAIICIVLCYIGQQNHKASRGLFVATMIIAYIFAAIRYQFGPDWFNYYDDFKELRLFGVKDYLFYNSHEEPLFIGYLSLFPSYTLFLATNSLFWFSTYTLFFKKYVNEKYYWFVLLMLFFNTDCILNNLVAMRHAMSSFMFLMAFMLLDKQQYSKKGKIWFVSIMVLCTLFHTSCLLLIPLVFVNNKKSTLFFSKTTIYVIVVLSIITVFAGRNIFSSQIAGLLIGNIEDFQRYETYLRHFTSTSSGFVALVKYAILTLFNLVPLIFIIQQGSKEENPTQLFIYKIGIIIATVSCIFGQGIISRYMMILNPFYIIAVIRACSMSKKQLLKVTVLLCVSISSVYSFYYYLQADYCISFLKYKTVFSAPFIP